MLNFETALHMVAVGANGKETVCSCTNSQSASILLFYSCCDLYNIVRIYILRPYSGD